MLQSFAQEMALATLQVVDSPEEIAAAAKEFFNWADVKAWLIEFARQNAFVFVLAAMAFLRSLGTTVRTGYTGLFFSFGRATRVLQPGFVLKIPYFQRVRLVPTRSRTMDVPDQKVTSGDGLVWYVDVNLVYRVVDVRRALIEVNDLVEGMKQMLGVSVQRVMQASDRHGLRLSSELDRALAEAMEVHLEAWGVVVERAGFTSIRPSPKTLRLTQQVHTSAERRRALVRLEERGLERGLALAALGNPPRVESRARRARAREQLGRRRLGVRRALRRARAASDDEVSRRAMNTLGQLLRPR